MTALVLVLLVCVLDACTVQQFSPVLPLLIFFLFCRNKMREKESEGRVRQSPLRQPATELNPRAAENSGRQ